MGVDASRFSTATPQTSGITASHIQNIHTACQKLNTFLFVRPSTVPTMRLIDAGFATKSMDIHDKSSDWGLTSGLVPVDQAFSKALTGQPNADIHPHGHGEAQAVHLNLAQSFTTLNGQGHFEVTQEITTPLKCTDAHPLKDFRHFHSSKNETVCFLMAKNTAGNVKAGNVYWQQRTAPAKLTPVWVWGYKGTPVTGDYDMWMVAPHIDRVSGESSIHSNKDKHGRSAATAFTSGMIKELNAACNRVNSPVFNHGAEAQNVSFTQAMDKRLAVFTPGKMAPFTITRILLPGILHDLLLHGYVVVRNPKWLSGVTLGVEDMADAADQFPDDPMVKVGVGAKDKLKAAAALAMYNRYNQVHKSAPPMENKAWKERYDTLRYFRAVARMPDPSSSPETLMLPADAFPHTGRGSNTDARESAMKLGQKMEQEFGRTGFKMEDGHLSPVDQTRNVAGGAAPGTVKNLINNQPVPGSLVTPPRNIAGAAPGSVRDMINNMNNRSRGPGSSK